MRTTVHDGPGALARLATACGGADVDILGLQVFASRDGVVDELVVDAPTGWTDVQVARLFEDAGGTQVAATRVDDSAAADAATRYLRMAHDVLQRDRDVTGALDELLGTAPPDVADYAGHDELDLARRDGSSVRVSRAVAFTDVERARAQAFLSVVGDAGADSPPIKPSARDGVPVVRAAGLPDLEAVSALHERCSVETLYDRYQVPLTMPMTTRMARRLVAPDGGTALVVQVGPDVVGHGLLEPVDGAWTFRMIIEDAWQQQGLGSRLVTAAARRAAEEGAPRLTFVTVGSYDRLLRAVGRAGLVARVERHDGAMHVTVPLRGVLG